MKKKLPQSLDTNEAAALVRQAQVLAGQAGLREGGLRLAGLYQEDGHPGHARGCGGEGGST